MPSSSLRSAGQGAEEEALLSAFVRVREFSRHLAAPLSPEDQAAQSMGDASPAKWHLGHTTWFFETFILGADPDYKPYDSRFGFIFNSYYETLGPRQPRPQRGLLTRPSADEVRAYRERVDQEVARFLGSGALGPEVLKVAALGLHHEQQHQELLLTDILHLLAHNPLEPAYAAADAASAAGPSGLSPMGFKDFEGGLVHIGAAGGPSVGEFAFDNEGPRHAVYLTPYQLADRLVSNAEWRAFIEDDGYSRPEFWLSEGWARVQSEGWRAPLYWRREGDDYSTFTLFGRRPVCGSEPVVHISFYEADAFARWRGLRLPTEAEWENAAAATPVEGRFAESGGLRPMSAPDGAGLRQLWGDCWEWTASPYTGYPGFSPPPGAVGEYNGKFMINQMVLRGGSCATPLGHVRPSYRNFFHPHQRWQFSGLRLAADEGRHRIPAAVVDAAFRQDVLRGLSSNPKSIPSKYFYDKAGSELFEEICRLNEYYPTRAETALLRKISVELSVSIPEGSALVEFGSGSSTKTRILLDAAPQLAVYAPLDISASAVKPAAEAVAQAYGGLRVVPVVQDFTRLVRLPDALAGAPKVGFFPGSTIGNFSPEAAEAFLRSVLSVLGPGSSFIVGVDLVKEEEVLLAAYNDARGVTAEFNLNLLDRINRELSADFRRSDFRHLARWNAAESRMEMHLQSLKNQTVWIGSRPVQFAAGETIHTENSYKYQTEDFTRLAARAGWSLGGCWISEKPEFAIFRLCA